VPPRGSLPDISIQSDMERITARNTAPESSNRVLANKRILLVNANLPERKSLASQLKLYDEFETVECETGAQALALIDAESFDGILLDAELSDANGREVCRTIRRKDVFVPVMMLSAEEGEADEILSFEVGADDFLTKPVRPGVLIARLRAHLRQAEWSGNAALPIGPYAFRPVEKLLHQIETNEQITLSNKECAILSLLFRAGDSGVSREVLYREIWGYTSALDTHTLQTHIYRLRRKIEAEPSRPTLLLSKSGGYLLARHSERSR
jgi:DNA-binding response OmpR family regulator